MTPGRVFPVGFPRRLSQPWSVLRMHLVMRQIEPSSNDASGQRAK